MAQSIETLTVTVQRTPLDLLLWRRFGRAYAAMVERTLTINPGLAALGEYLPLGTRVRVEVPLPAKRRTPSRVVRLFD